MKDSLQNGFYLEQSEGHLQLAQEGSRMKPLWIDFTQGGRSVVQLRRKLGRSNPLFRAVGALGETQHVWDLTAGLGSDALNLAVMGYSAFAVERSPVVYALLEDAVRRAAEHADFADLLEQRLRFVCANSLDTLENKRPLPDVIYLDPMYPEKRKSALPRKEMLWLKQLVGEDDSGVQLLQRALQLGVRRVVVKRPVKGPPLLPDPTHRFVGQTTRFDLYLGEERAQI